MTNSNVSEKSLDQKESSDRLRQLSQETGIPVMDLRKDEWRGCTTKTAYDTGWEATQAAAVGREDSGHSNIYGYKCRYCPMWHIGHQGKTHLAKGILCPICRRHLNRRKYLGHIEWHKNQGAHPRYLNRMHYNYKKATT